MIIHIGKNEYRINNSFVSSSKNLLLRILRKVKEESNIEVLVEYYINLHNHDVRCFFHYPQ